MEGGREGGGKREGGKEGRQGIYREKYLQITYLSYILHIIVRRQYSLNIFTFLHSPGFLSKVMFELKRSTKMDSVSLCEDLHTYLPGATCLHPMVDNKENFRFLL